MILARILKNSLEAAEFDYYEVSMRGKDQAAGYYPRCSDRERVIIKDMLDRFIGPIKLQDGIEALRDIITESEYRVQGGMLQRPREIETFLIYNGKVCQWS